MFPNFTFFIEIFGTVAFAMSGSFAAMQKRFDPFGVLIIASVSYTHLDVYKRQELQAQLTGDNSLLLKHKNDNKIKE